MAFPTLAAIGAEASSTSADINVVWPAHVQDQLGVLLIISEHASGTPLTVSPGASTWTAIPSGNQTSGTGSTGVRMQLYRKFASNSSEPNVLVPISTNASVRARIYLFDNCITTTSPINASAGSAQGSVTGIALPSVTTDEDDCLVLLFAAHGSSATLLGNLVNGNLANITAETVATSYVVFTGEKADDGATGTTTGTWTTARPTCSVTVALQPNEDTPVLTSVATLDMRPDRSGYSNLTQSGVLEFPREGGLSYKRLDVMWAPHTVTVNWILHNDEYTEFMGFFHTALQGGVNEFMLDIITDIGVPTRHKCRTIGMLPKLTKQEGKAYWVTCTLEAAQNPTYTGKIRYNEAGEVFFIASNPNLAAGFAAGDVVRIIDSKGVHPVGSTPLNLDGEYTIDSVVGNNTLVLDNPTAVTADWTVLAALGTGMEYGNAGNGDVISTITRVPQ